MPWTNRFKLVNAIQQDKPVEDDAAWRFDDTSEQNTANRLTLIAMKLPGLRGRAKRTLAMIPSPENDALLLCLIHDARAVDLELQRWELSLTDAWRARTVGLVQEMRDPVLLAKEWPGPIQTYEDMYIANIRNDHRICRIFCATLILKCLDSLALPGTHFNIPIIRQEAQYVTESMVNEVCASVPFHMRYGLQANAHMAGQDEVGKTIHFPSLKGECLQCCIAAEAIGAYFLVWPCHVCKEIEYISEKQREWFTGRLHYIRRTFGLNQAQMLVMARRQVVDSGPSLP